MNDDWSRCDCGGLYRYSPSQRIDDGRLVWGAACGCGGCGIQEEMDGIGLPPPELRSMLLADWGVHVLTIEHGVDVVSALRQLETVLGIGGEAVAALAGRIPGPAIAGTQWEMEWLADALGVRGVPVSVSRKELSRDADTLDLADVLPEYWDQPEH